MVFQRLKGVIAEFFIALFPPGKTHDCVTRWKVSVTLKVVKGREQLTCSQVAGGAEDNDGAGLRRFAAGAGFPQRILIAHGCLAVLIIRERLNPIKANPVGLSAAGQSAISAPAENPPLTRSTDAAISPDW